MNTKDAATTMPNEIIGMVITEVDALTLTVDEQTQEGTKYCDHVVGDVVQLARGSLVQFEFLLQYLRGERGERVHCLVLHEDYRADQPES